MRCLLRLNTHWTELGEDHSLTRQHWQVQEEDEDEAAQGRRSTDGEELSRLASSRAPPLLSSSLRFADTSADKGNMAPVMKESNAFIQFLCLDPNRSIAVVFVSRCPHTHRSQRSTDNDIMPHMLSLQIPELAIDSASLQNRGQESAPRDSEGRPMSLFKQRLSNLKGQS